MNKALVGLAAVAVAILLAVSAYAADGYFDGKEAGVAARARADALIAAGRGSAGLGPGRIEQLLAVEDPGFSRHGGVDFASSGAGMTTLTQSLGKRLGFDRFRPGIRKIRLIGYASGLERTLRERADRRFIPRCGGDGTGPSGWMTGFYEASQTIYRRPPSALGDREFFSLVAVLIAPRRFDLRRPDAALSERVDRIERLARGHCRPTGVRDVWLEGCAAP
jgi:hypothetical protein